MNEIERLENANVRLFDSLSSEQMTVVKDWLKCLEDYYYDHVSDESRFADIPMRHLSLLQEGLVTVSGSAE